MIGHVRTMGRVQNILILPAARCEAYRCLLVYAHAYHCERYPPIILLIIGQHCWKDYFFFSAQVNVKNLEMKKLKRDVCLSVGVWIALIELV